MNIASEAESPALWHLMGAYLHQDYAYDGTVDDNIDLFVSDTPDRAPALPAEVERALRELSSEAELEAFVDALGCQINAPRGLTYREWLTQIADRVRAATA
jgi:ABC-type multidrug transport system fused ATPase/permease subunit